MQPVFARLYSIRGRLSVLVVAAIGASSLAAGGMSLLQSTSLYGRQKRDTLFATAQVLSAAAARGVAEGDRRAIYEAVRAIGRIDTITYVAVADRDGRPLADLGATEQLAGDLVLHDAREEASLMALLGSRSIEIGVPIVRGGETIGSLTLLSSTDDLWPRLRGAVASTLAGALVALIFGLAVAMRLQRGLSRPLTALSAAMKRVGERHDFSVNVEGGQKGEIGVLVGGFNGMLAEIRDRDRRLEAHREHLEAEVEARTVDLVAARDSAEDANVRKSQFLATMSHEIRTPMNGMLVMAELLASSELPARARRYAEVVSRSGQSLLAIINDILDFSKIEAGKMELEKLAIDPAECAETVVSLFYARARDKGLDLCARVDLDVAEIIEADPVRLGQVLGNLVNNALKFTEKGGVELRVARDAAIPGAVRFSVADTGVGIPADKLASVFEVFSQADQSTTRKHGGTGLGLAICQRLVGAMGGEIVVASEVGAGSTFSFALRCDVERARPPALRSAFVTGRAPAARGDRHGASNLRANHGLLFERSRLRHVLRRLRHSRRRSLHRRRRRAGILLDPARNRSGLVLALGEIGDPAADRCLASGLADMVLQAPTTRGDILSLLARLARGERPALPAAAPAAEALRQYRGARVLVVDDSPVNREVAIEALARFGVTPDVAEDGLRAVEACAARDYDLVLMDGSMPGLDGFEATRRIRAAEVARGRRMAIVALTAQVVGAGAEAWRDAGMDGVLHKPFSLARLGETLIRHLVESAAAFAVTLKAEPPVIDPGALSGLRDGQPPAFAARVVGLYRAHAPKAAADIARDFAKGDLAALASAAHALKSMSLSIGATRVASAAGEIERLAKFEGGVSDRDLVSRLPDEIARACEALSMERLAA